MAITLSYTANDIIKYAMLELGVLAAGGTPKAAEVTDGIFHLNLLLKEIAAYGFVPWREETGTTSFSASTASVTLSPRPAEVSHAWVTASGTDTQMGKIGFDVYQLYPAKTTSGTPVTFAIKHERDAVKMYVYPVPSSTTTVNYLYSKVIEDISTGSDTVELPQHWFRYITASLAFDMASTFGVTRSDPAAVEVVKRKAEEARIKIMDHDRPPSYYLEGRTNAAG